MFKHIILVAFATLIVGCTATGVQNNGLFPQAQKDGLENYNVVKDSSIVVNGKTLPFVSFEKREQKIVVENGQKFKDTLDDFGSGIQWNNDYVVTAKHVNFVEGSAYQCGEGCEVQFIKHKAVVAVPAWREVVAEENMTFVGIDKTFKPRSGSGKDLDRVTKTTSIQQVVAKMSMSITVGGMSGGPAYGDDGKVIGMLTGGVSGLKNDGTTDEGLAAKGNDFSVYLPYSVIQAEWNKFQAQQHNLASK